MQEPLPFINGASVEPRVPLDLVWILPLLLVAAVLYTSVGHGGATLYLAILTLAGYAVDALVPTILTVNIVAAGIAFLVFRQAGHLRLRLLVPFVVTSVPLAFVGGLVDVGGRTGQILLGTALLLASFRFLLVTKAPARSIPMEGWLYLVGAPLLGAVLGFLAGATGIGGGVFLSPILILLGWGDVREAGNVAAAFIVLNSAAGLAARVASTPVDVGFLVPVVLVVTAGAMVGSVAGARKLRAVVLRTLLGVVLFAAGLKSLFAT